MEVTVRSKIDIPLVEFLKCRESLSLQPLLKSSLNGSWVIFFQDVQQLVGYLHSSIEQPLLKQSSLVNRECIVSCLSGEVIVQLSLYRGIVVLQCAIVSRLQMDVTVNSFPSLNIFLQLSLGPIPIITVSAFFSPLSIILKLSWEYSIIIKGFK